MLDPKRADVQSIEAELAVLWRNISEAKQDSGAVLRACLLNLIVVAQNQQEADMARQVIADVTQDHPCRAVVMFVDSTSQENAVEAWVTAHCQLPNERSEQVCCEQIFIRSRGQQAAGMVAPLLIADLPVFVWQMGRFELSSVLSQRLLSLADRWICDSLNFVPFDPTLVSQLAQSGQTALSDINWSRLTPWREIIAQFFDSASSRSQLDCVSQLNIESSDAWQAWLMVGWLGSRLGWQPMQPTRLDDHTQRLSLTGNSRSDTLVDATVTILPHERAEFTRVELVTPEARFAVVRTGDNSVSARAALAGHEPLERNVMMRAFSPSQYVCGELEILGHDKVYEESLAWIDQVGPAIHG